MSNDEGVSIYREPGEAGEHEPRRHHRALPARFPGSTDRIVDERIAALLVRLSNRMSSELDLASQRPQSEPRMLSFARLVDPQPGDLVGIE